MMPSKSDLELLDQILAETDEAFGSGCDPYGGDYDNDLWYECDRCNEEHNDYLRETFECDCEPPEDLSTEERDDWYCGDCEPDWEATRCECGWAEEEIRGQGDWEEILTHYGFHYLNGSSRYIWVNRQMGVALKIENENELDQNRWEQECIESGMAPNGALLNAVHRLPSGRECLVCAPEVYAISPNERVLAVSYEEELDWEDSEQLNRWGEDESYPGEAQDKRWFIDNISQDSYRHNYWIHAEKPDDAESPLYAMIFDLGFVSDARRYQW
jgi:hypothetical protein